MQIQNILNYLEASAASCPEKAAFEDLEHSYTFAQVQENARRMGSALAAELSRAADYPAVADAALCEMLRRTGAPVFGADGYLQRGVIVRHLALPGHVEDSLAVLRRLAEIRREVGVPFLTSLMSQFTPFYHAEEHHLGRRITTYEYRKVVNEAIALGLTDGYMQEKSSAREEYTPPFDLEGV